MFRVKICGVTNVADAVAACQAGADAIGLNFYPQSRRYVSPEAAREIAAAVPPQVCKVGVFVGASADQIRETVQSLGLDLVQLHGEEAPEFLRSLRPLPFAKAVRANGSFESVSSYLADCHRLSCLPRMLLVDAVANGEFGGTGTTVDWQQVRDARPAFRGLPLVLAGGLTPDNVAEGIAAVRPWAVDLASGVEASPGKKSPELMNAFVAAARQAFARG